jgi:hypothetical protein
VERAEKKLAEAESQPGSGKIPQATPESAGLLGQARAAAADPANPTSVLDSLANRLSGDAKTGLAQFRKTVGDATALRAIESTSTRGLDIKNFLATKGMTEAQLKAAEAEVVKAQVAAARARLIEAETVKDPALREAARAEQFKALTEILRKYGILRNAKVQKALLNRNLDGLISAIGEAIARTQLRAKPDYAGKSNFKLRSNLVVVREVPGYKSVSAWRNAEKARLSSQPNGPKGAELEKILSRKAARLFEKNGKVYESMGEMDIMMTEVVKGGKPRPVEVSEVKTGGEKASDARAQLNQASEGLSDIAAKKPGVYLYERTGHNQIGKDVSSEFDLSQLSTLKQSVYGLEGRQGYSSLGVTEESIAGLAASLIKSLPPKGQTPALPPPTKENEEED